MIEKPSDVDDLDSISVFEVFQEFPSIYIKYEDDGKSYLMVNGKRFIETPVSGFRVFSTDHFKGLKVGDVGEKPKALGPGFVIGFNYLVGDIAIPIPDISYKPEQMQEFNRDLLYGNQDDRERAMKKLGKLRTKDISDLLIKAFKGGFRVRKRAWLLLRKRRDFYYSVFDQINALDVLAENYSNDGEIRSRLIKALTPVVEETRNNERLSQRFSYPNCPEKLGKRLGFRAKTWERKGINKYKVYGIDDIVWYNMLPVYRRLGLTSQQDYQLVERYFEERK